MNDIRSGRVQEGKGGSFVFVEDDEGEVVTVQSLLKFSDCLLNVQPETGETDRPQTPPESLVGWTKKPIVA